MIFASNNTGKIKEIKEILTNYEIKSPKELNIKLDVEEDGNTFLENAVKKAKVLYDIAHQPVIADDSGLIIEDLGDWPGINTNRFLGENKSDREKNLAIISRVNKECKNRNAKVICALVYYDGKQLIFSEGVIDGTISTEPRGKNGFGFDEIFEYNNKTLAELSPVEKNKISARKRAAEELKKKIEKVI